MRRPEPDGWKQVNSRMFSVGKALNWKWTENTFIKVAGYTEVNVADMPTASVGKIIRCVQKGYTTGRTGVDYVMLRFLAKHNPIKPIGIGYMGRTQMIVYYPKPINCHAVVKELHTLQELEKGSTRSLVPYVVTDNPDTDETTIHTRMYKSRRGEGGPPASEFTRAVKVIDHYMRETLSHRQPVIDWLETCPMLRVPFMSHDRTGAWRAPR